MSIKTKFTLIIVTVALFSFGVIFFTFLQQQDLSRDIQESRVSAEILKGTFELSELANDYLIHPGARAGEQWGIRYKSLLRTTDSLVFHSEEETEILDSLKIRHKDLEVSFLKLKTNIDDISSGGNYSKELEERLRSDFFVKSSAAVSLASEMIKVVRTELETLQNRVILLTVFSTSVLGIAGVLILLTLIRATIKIIFRFKSSMRVVSKGDLAHRILVDRNDEVGSLAAGFNEMIEKLEESREELKELDHMKSDFISIVSHQLRTPLTGIRWAVERFMKRKDEFSKEDQMYLEGMEVSSMQLTEIVSQMLNVSRIEGGGIVISPEEVDVTPIIKGLIKRFSPIGRFHKVAVESSFPEDKLIAKTDSNVVHSIVHSILSNAIDYTPKGGNVSVSLEKDEKTFSILVTDTGIGIPKKEISKLFTKFYRAENAKRFKPGGTGLGLYIVRQAVSMLGGDIAIESEEGEGTKVRVTLPLHSQKRKGGVNPA